MVKYNKLVRDKIPAILTKKGLAPIWHTANLDEYHRMLNLKLLEEAAEFIDSDEVEELADVLEVVYALAEIKKVKRIKLERIRARKAKLHGSFKNRIILERVIK